MKRFNFDCEFETEQGTIYAHAEGHITNYYPATMYRKNGDPGDPEEGGECEYDEISATDDGGNDVDFPEYLFDDLDEKAIENATDDEDRDDYEDFEEEE